MWGKFNVILSFLIVFGFHNANADLLEGVVKTGSTYLKIELKAPGPLQLLNVLTNNQTVAGDLMNLTNNDAIVGRGTVTSEAVSLDSIDFVSLKNLNGVWENLSEGVSIEFVSSQKLNLYTKTSVNYTYSLSPLSEGVWTVLYASSANNDVIGCGTLYFDNAGNSDEFRMVLTNQGSKKPDVDSTFIKRPL